MASRREKLPRGKQPGEEHKSGYAALSQDNEEVAEEEIPNQPPGKFEVSSIRCSRY